MFPVLSIWLPVSALLLDCMLASLCGLLLFKGQIVAGREPTLFYLSLMRITQLAGLLNVYHVQFRA
jgi:hypothetical protein